MGSRTRVYKQTCHCSHACSDCPDFEKIIDLSDEGLAIYRHKIDTDKELRKVSTTGNIRESNNVFIIHNTTDTDISTKKIELEYDGFNNCPRCKYIFEHAKKLFLDVLSINKQGIIGICDHCKDKNVLKSCKGCQTAINKFIAGKTKEMYNEKELKMWLSRIEDVLYEVHIEERKSPKFRSHSASYIRNLYKITSNHKPIREPQIKQMYEKSKGPFKIPLDSIRKSMRSTGINFSDNDNEYVLYKSISESHLSESRFQKYRKPSRSDENLKIAYPTSMFIDHLKVNGSSVTLNSFEDYFQITKDIESQTSKYQPSAQLHSRVVTPTSDMKKDQNAYKIQFDSKTPNKLMIQPQYSKDPRFLEIKEIDQSLLSESLTETSPYIISKFHKGIKKEAAMPFPILRKYKSDVSLAPSMSTVTKELRKDFSYFFIKDEEQKKIPVQKRISSSVLIKDTQDMLRTRIEEKNKKREQERKKKLEEQEKKKCAQKEKKLIEEQNKALQEQNEKVFEEIKEIKNVSEKKRVGQSFEEESIKKSKEKTLRSVPEKRKEVEPKPTTKKPQADKEEFKNQVSISKEPKKNKEKYDKEERARLEKEQKLKEKKEKEEKEITKKDEKENAKKEKEDKEIVRKEKQDKEIARKEKEERFRLEKEEQRRLKENKELKEKENIEKKEKSLKQKEDKIGAQSEGKNKQDHYADEMKKMLAEQAKLKEANLKMKKQQDDDNKKQKETADKKAKEEAEYKLKSLKETKNEDKNESEKPSPAKKIEKPKIKDLNIDKIKIKNPSSDDLILKLVKLKQTEPKRERPRRLSDINISKKMVATHKRHKNHKTSSCEICCDSELELDIENIISNKSKGEEIADIIIGQKILKFKPPLLQDIKENEIVPLLFTSSFNEDPAGSPKRESIDNIKDNLQSKPIKPDKKKIEQEAPKGVIRYALSDRSFIEKGWTMLPTEKVVRKMNVYRMRPAHPEFDWFEHNKNKKLMHYDTGEKLAEFDDNGRGRWFYRSGRIALDYYDAEEINAQQRFVIYSSGDPDERGRSRPFAILATFDYLGNGIVFDHAGKIRLKYNQTEGVVLDRSIGPVSHWKWHTLNDPPVLQQVMIDTQMAHKDPEILKLGGPGENKTRPDNEEMLAIEFDNFIKEKSKKLTQKFKPFQIKMKALKINEQFSLKVLDQATIYLIFRDGTTNLKVNIGMILDHQEIVDTDTAEVGEVSNSLERFPARTDSLAGLQRSVAYAQRVERSRMERERRLRPTMPSTSSDKLTAAISRPLRPPLRTVPSCSTVDTEDCRFKCVKRPPCNNLYYDTRLI